MLMFPYAPQQPPLSEELPVPRAIFTISTGPGRVQLQTPCRIVLGLFADHCHG
jgi:hypothetical protein